MREIPWLAEKLLASQKGLCSMALVSQSYEIRVHSVQSEKQRTEETGVRDADECRPL
jgi:hypothetical protein